MTCDKIRPATIADVEALDAALRNLSAHMGDSHKATADDLRRAGFGDQPSFRALVAEQDDRVSGVALYSPVFSTVRGASGIYVSDLWVSDAVRGSGLGRRLLAAALDDAKERWGATYIRLTVYHDNTGARAFYEKLGFMENDEEHYLILSGQQLQALSGIDDEGDS